MPRVSTKVTHQLVLALLTPLSASGVRVYGHHEPPPVGDADRPGDTPVERWCRVAAVVPTPRTRRSAASTGDADSHTLAVTVTVGNSNARQLADPTAIETDADLVAAALDGVETTAAGHTLVLERATAQPLPADAAHEGHRLFVVTATGRVGC